MYIIKIRCADSIGVAARITAALRDVGVNTRNMHFRTRDEFRGWFWQSPKTVGEGEIVIKDEDWDLVDYQLRSLAKKRKNLDLKINKPSYQVTLLLFDQPGALDDELQKLAKNGIDVREIKSGEPRNDKKVLVKLILECSPDKYDLAKKLLSRYLQDESPFLATAVRDLV
jgi:predicted amino acid-binding ACT domain protein